jgi:hypothetical protein
MQPDGCVSGRRVEEDAEKGADLKANGTNAEGDEDGTLKRAATFTEEGGEEEAPA